MSLQYTHLLIPECVELVPRPAQVVAFLEGLVKLNCAPLGATFRVGKLSGSARTGINPLTGEELSIGVRDFTPLGSTSEIPELLAGLDDYDVIVSGQGPSILPPFTLYTATQSAVSEFKGTYGYDVRCRLRSAIVSTCEIPPFGGPGSLDGRNGIFHHPITGATMEVPNAACARFWIEFQFGKWLLPKIGNSLNLLQPAILSNAIEHFGIEFAQ